MKFVEFLERCRKEWGFTKDVFIDSADQATITELRKYKRLNGCLYKFIDAYKKWRFWTESSCSLMDSAELLPGCDTCMGHIAELERYSWDEEKDKPEDRNDHTINANQYAWIPLPQNDWL